jgi:hypothetical protein
MNRHRGLCEVNALSTLLQLIISVTYMSENKISVPGKTHRPTAIIVNRMPF